MGPGGLALAARAASVLSRRVPGAPGRVRARDANLRGGDLRRLLSFHRSRSRVRRRFARAPRRGKTQSAAPQMRGSTSPIGRASTASAIASNCVGCAFTITTRAPAAFASGTTPATG